ncbi:GNAT family N-acetyltransferase [Belnapia sp. T18]|uniref:GNAT family N-acetyltransferase n=1 Tax=Belnapia arida TaxID=2804533 RepID=A0ABS1U2J1_9PROT|nr:GNAT family N-acetyltransferase [Belnapia arida]MBL6078904.1 GNAT family N-acetyltransferase [Belnapia arida]
MPTSAAFHRLEEADLPGALALSAEAGWNQVAEDWRLFLRHGAVHGLRGADGGWQATGAVLPYGSFGWISMVLVTEAARGRGLGTAVLREAMAALEAAGQVAFLDATPAGERIYRPLGFRPVFPLMRWRGEGQGGTDLPGGLRLVEPADLPALVALDAAAFGVARPDILADLWRRTPEAALMLADGSGFILARPGRQALQLGPMVAANEAAAAGLLGAALGRARGPVLLDLPRRWFCLATLLAKAGFREERPYLRMALGRETGFGDDARLFLIAGPELG